MRVNWVNSWFDPGRERETVTAFIDQKADAITHHTDSTAAVVTAQEKGVGAIAYYSDMSKYGADAHLTAVTHQRSKYYIDRVQSVLDGNWKTGSTKGGAAAGMTDLAPLNESVPAEVADQVAVAKTAIADGRLHPFAGPVVGQDGSVIIPEGENMDDAKLTKMNFYVKGVVGSLPK